MQLISLLEPIRPQIERVEGLVDEKLAAVEEPLQTMLRRSVGGGKHLRPALIILIGQMFAVPLEPFHRLAAAVDMLHAATLIHDDLVDRSALRRGRETLHTIWPAGATVLAGDYLLGQATLLIAELEHPPVCKVFADVLCTMCAGEIRRMLSAQDAPERWQDYYRGIEAKTASLFAASAEMAAILAGAEASQRTALCCFARELGIAFQIVDDVLDLTGNEVLLGKPQGSDLRQGLLTLPILYYLESRANPNPVSTVLAGQRDEAQVRAAIEAVCASEAIEAALQEASNHVRCGQEALATLPDNESCRLLGSLAAYVVERER